MWVTDSVRISAHLLSGRFQCLNTDTSSLSYVAVRREIESLNERLTGDGQAVEGGDPTKGALKTKGP